jgi:hypothetical protein
MVIVPIALPLGAFTCAQATHLCAGNMQEWRVPAKKRRIFQDL